MRDLARWIGFQLQIGPSSEAGPNVLAGSTLEEMHRPQFLDSDWRVGHCLAWLARRRGDEIHVGHEGSLPGYRSAHYFNKSTRSGVVVLTNRGWQNGAHDASLALLDAVVAEARTQTSAGPHTSTEAMPSAYEPLLGIYAFHGIPDMRVVYRAGQLRIEAENPVDGSLHAPSALLPTADPLVFEVVEGRGAGELGHFRAVEGGEILAFALGAAVYWKKWLKLATEPQIGPRHCGDRTISQERIAGIDEELTANAEAGREPAVVDIGGDDTAVVALD